MTRAERVVILGIGLVVDGLNPHPVMIWVLGLIAVVSCFTLIQRMFTIGHILNKGGWAIDPRIKSARSRYKLRIPKGAKHRLENNKEEDLIIIEVQYGNILREDDIIRYEDIYNRK